MTPMRLHLEIDPRAQSALRVSVFAFGYLQNDQLNARVGESYLRWNA